MRAKITIGVPVYNGERLLDDCLRCLAAQTAADFDVLIMDNASTDRTPEIAQDFASRDPRFRVLRQPETVDVRQNFADVLAAADSEYFAWRAYDDLCSPNWVAALGAALDAAPEASLAVGRVTGLNQEGLLDADRDAPAIAANAPLAELRRLTLALDPSWFYGLFRRATLECVFERCRRLYPYVWSLDVLLLLSVILDRGLVSTNAVTFQYRATGQSRVYLRPNHYRDSWAMWRSFHQAASALLRDSMLSPAEQRRFRWTLLRLTDQRTERFRRILRGGLRAWLLGGDGRLRDGPPTRQAASPAP